MHAMERSLLYRCALAAFAGILAVSAAQASNGFMQRFDQNGDGQVTRMEAKAALAARFTRMDNDGDGNVSRAERRTDRKIRQFHRMDTNGDGRVTLQEMDAATQRRVQSRFQRLDTNGDGALSLVEAQAGKRKGPGAMTLQDLDARVMRMFDRADQNRDGVITSNEASLMRRHD
jgi:Ca2+-binding EF-hand superfamily protein